MKVSHKIDYAKLLGFESVGEQICGTIDFRDEILAAKLGAKVGADPANPNAPIEAAKG
jgi:hypothetical protein